MQVRCELCGKDLLFDETNACIYCGYPAPEDIAEVTDWVNKRLDEDFPDDFKEEETDD